MLTPQRKGSDYHHGDLRHAAIMAARKLVAEHGIPGLGLRKVSEKVAVSPAALYRHFEDLEQLRAELSAQVRIEIGELMVAKRDRAPKSKSRRRNAIVRFEALGEGYVEYAKRNPRLFEIAFTFCDRDPSIKDADLAHRALEESVYELAEAGLLSSKTAEIAPMLAWSSVHGLATLIAQEAIPAKEHATSLQQIFQGVQLALFKR